ncbi:MAG: aldo/keto reductase [Candidatus Latescibacteria bacterium]|nr:aldo/keto reductase [Candidatus Latescibacterota bacterium]MDP7238644.1 aldo/keto reductase [Candidatus Latescibacterota bacterium]
MSISTCSTIRALLTPIEEMLDALNGLVQQGKVRYVGCCNFSGW